MLNNVPYYHTGGWPSPFSIFFLMANRRTPNMGLMITTLTISPICSPWIHWRFKSTWHCRLKSIKFDDHHLCKIRGFFVRWLIWIQIYWGDSYQIPDHATSTFQDFYSKITTVCGHFGFYDFDNISNRLSGKGSLHLVSRINPSCPATCPTDGATQRPGAWNSS